MTRVHGTAWPIWVSPQIAAAVAAHQQAHPHATQHEIAQALGCSVSTVNRAIKAAKEREAQ